MNSSSTLDFTQMLMTKFCHDITGPIGAVNNGVELMLEDVSMREAGMELITGSAEQAIARVQFYRFAYGILKSNGYADMPEKRALAEGIYKDSRMTLNWHDPHVPMTQKQCQLLFNMLLIASASLIRGGILDIYTHEGAEKARTITIKASGQTVMMDESIRQALDGTAVEMTGKNVQAHYTKHLVESEAGAALELQADDQACMLTYQAGAVQE